MHLVPKQPKPARTKRQEVLDRVAALAPSHMLKCPRCGSMEFLQTVAGVEVTAAGKTRGGTKQYICLHCWRNGERIVCR